MRGPRQHRAGAGGLAAVLRRRLGRPSPLLVTAALALLLASVRLGGLVGRIEPSAPPASPVEAAGPSVAEGAGGGAEPPASLLDAFLPLGAIEPAAGPGPNPPPVTAGAPAASASSGAVSSKPPRLAPGDPLADVAEELQRRAAELDRRQEEVALREAALAALEARLADQLERLAALKKEVEATAKRIREKDEAEVAQLVKTYEAMKAKSAAQVFDQLPLDVLLPIVRRMREAKLAAVLAAMEPAKAKQVTTALAQTTPLPRLP
jgi:flagellar motility protein MotE (MotC chaperone)